MSYSKIHEFQTALEIVSARLQWVIEHRRFSTTWEQELDALSLAIKSLQQWLQEYTSSLTPQYLEEFITMHQIHLRLENKFTSTQF